MTALTKPQEIFVARVAILNAVEMVFDFSVSKEDDLEDLKAGRTLAKEDLEKAREIMEEQAAFGYTVARLEAEHPTSAKSALQKAARSLVADPEARAQAALSSGVYTRMGFDEVPS